MSDKHTENVRKTHACDSISRQAAIDAMCNACSDWCDEGVCKKVSAIQKLQSAQPDVPDTNVGDLINRQAAIDALENTKEVAR